MREKSGQWCRTLAVEQHDPPPGKQRTRQHVIEALSINYVERFIFEAGHTSERVAHDYGYDRIVFTFDERGFLEPDRVYLQFKASETLREGPSGNDFVFDLDVADYNLWTAESNPVFLILYDASRRRAWWLDVQRFFRENPSRQPRPGRKTVRVYVPKPQVINAKAIAHMRARKQELFGRPEGASDHA
jgi:Domain of unknown function (DUF4365)